ncbi:MAG: AzlC family ABC transporter permease [Hyphomicrobiales bacterium]|nr:AzlC family ABC transporter permease [Hyphomicrobiales bacterium]
MSQIVELTPADRRRWFMEGVRQAFTGPAYFVAVALIGVGGLARAAGFPAGVAVLSTLLIWAGPAQLLFFGAAAAKTSWLAVAVSVSLSSIRFLPMCLSVLPMLRTPGTRRSTLWLAAHFVAVTVWVESLRRLPDIDRPARMPFFFGFALACILTTSLFTGVGYFLVAALPPALAVGVLFLSPVYFLATLIRGARAPVDWFALTAGLVLAPVTEAFVGGGLDLMALGLVGGTAAYLAGRWHEARRAEP